LPSQLSKYSYIIQIIKKIATIKNWGQATFFSLGTGIFRGQATFFLKSCLSLFKKASPL
jgi:hypothetical protein